MSDHLLENYNQNRYRDAKSGNQEIDWLYSVTSAEAPESDVDMAWQKLSRKISKKSAGKRNLTIPILQIAASIALLAVCIFIYQGYFTDSSELIIKQSYNEKSQIVFPDGSRAVLNVNSKVEFLEEFGDIREVYFSGEAYFEIKKNKKPFVIRMGDVDVRVLGTAFNLITRKYEIQVMVDRGLVAMETGFNQVKITKGEQGTFNLNTLQISVDTTPPSNVMSWRNGKFSFQETSLEIATKELAEYYDVTFKLSSAIKNCKITATFNNAPLKDVLDVLEAILSVSIEQDKSIVKIKGKGCQ